MKMRKYTQWILVGAVAWTMNSSVSAQVPLQFNYQGRLTDSNGVPVAGVVTADFAIVTGGDATSGGLTGHLESAVSVTTDVSGIFSHVLGRSPSLIALTNLTEGTTSRWIQVAVGGEVLKPRQQILAVPYSLAAPGVIPVGGVIMWWGSTSAVPLGFEICNGAAPAPGSTLAGNKPDLRDKFVKGATNTAVDVKAQNYSEGAHFRTLVSNNIPPHIHGDNFSTTSDGEHSHGVIIRDPPDSTGDSNDSIDSNDAAGTDTISGLVTSSDGAHTHTINGGVTTAGAGVAFDNRPAFLEMFYIIRVK